MYLQMESKIGMELGEELQHGDGLLRVMVESAVEDTNIADAVLSDVLESFPYGFYRNLTYRFSCTADTECAGVEASACSFYLYKRLVPTEKTAGFGWKKFVKVQDSCDSSIMVSAVGDMA